MNDSKNQIANFPRSPRESLPDCQPMAAHSARVVFMVAEKVLLSLAQRGLAD